MSLYAFLPEVDLHRTPLSKMPDCPKCFEDELYMAAGRVAFCRQCSSRVVDANDEFSQGFSFELSQKLQSSGPPWNIPVPRSFLLSSVPAALLVEFGKQSPGVRLSSFRLVALKRVPTDVMVTIGVEYNWRRVFFNPSSVADFFMEEYNKGVPKDLPPGTRLDPWSTIAAKVALGVSDTLSVGNGEPIPIPESHPDFWKELRHD